MIEETIPSALDGERVDRIVSMIVGCTRSEAAAVINAGGAWLDGMPATIGKLRVRAGQTLRVDPALVPVTPPPAADPAVLFTVVYEDDELLVIDKPAGLVVHPGAGNADGTLVNGLLARYPEIAGVGQVHRPGIVHRLDVGTSGLMLVARTAAMYDALVAALGARQVGRTYQALVWGHPDNVNGVIDAPIGRDHRDPQRMAVVVAGKPARTAYTVDRVVSDPVEVAVLTCRLETGRTHQIRVHLAAIGHPVVGDPTYGGVRPGLSSPRPFLHAAALSFDHPTRGSTIELRSELPADLVAVLDGLGADGAV